jgi:SAM-dependent methyltransferase
MEQDERLRHASSFGAAATAYAEHRPDYAQAAVSWALDLAPGPRVLDLGAGTGKLTATLITLGAEVVAVEPDPAMLAELRSGQPAVRALPGSAEAIPLPDASVNAVLAGNAWHWFDMAVAGPEIARVLVPGGILAGLWNVLDNRVGWVAGLEQVSGHGAIGLRDTLSSWRAATAELYLSGRGPVTWFGAPEQAEFPHGQRRTADSLVATLATRAGMLVMPERDREAALGRIRAFLASRPETAHGEFTLPMLTGVLRVRRQRGNEGAFPALSVLVIQTETWAGSRACCTTTARSSRTATWPTASFSLAEKAATIRPASYRARLNRRSTARCTRRRTGLNSAATARVDPATATGSLIDTTRVASSTIPAYTPHQQAGDDRVAERPRNEPVDVEQAVPQDGHAQANRNPELPAGTRKAGRRSGEDPVHTRQPDRQRDANSRHRRSGQQPLQLLAAFPEERR